MLLYRAINNFSDVINLSNFCGITASLHGNIKTGLESAASHVANGSNQNAKDCWISTTKKFRICAEEFSIPQMGGYNTAGRRKKIAIIDRNKIIHSDAEYTPNGTYIPNINYTYISDGHLTLDLCDSKRWPCSSKPSARKMKEIKDTAGNIRKVNKKLMNEHVNEFNKHIEALNEVKTFVFDMTFPSAADRRSQYVPLNEFSFLDYYKSKIICSSKGMPIISGLVKNYSEVLILNKIPYTAISKVLEFLEIDILYALDDINFKSTLNNFICRKTIIFIQNNNIYINGNIITLNPNEQHLVHQLYDKNILMIDLVYAEYIRKGANNVRDILQIYNDFKNLKRGIINKALNAMGQNSNNRIVEDEIHVAVKNTISTNRNEILPLCKYDLIMIGDSANGEIYKVNCPDYFERWKASLNCSFSFMDISGKVTNCSFN